jgi:hypothetical protein
MACCIFVVGGVIQTSGIVIAMLYVGRLVAGIGVGFLTVSKQRHGSWFAKLMLSFSKLILPKNAIVVALRMGIFGGFFGG